MKLDKFVQVQADALEKKYSNWNKVRKEFGVSKTEARKLVRAFKAGLLGDGGAAVWTIWENGSYQVWKRTLEAVDGGSNMIHLSIKRNDREPIRDWRVMQEIKNMLVGKECEGMEMYPAESRLVDTANQYHMWVFEDPTVRWPWGFNEREVTNTPGGDAVQRRR